LLRLLKGRRTARRRQEVVVLQEAANAQEVARRLPDRQSMAWRPVRVCGWVGACLFEARGCGTSAGIHPRAKSDDADDDTMICSPRKSGPKRHCQSLKTRKHTTHTPLCTQILKHSTAAPHGRSLPRVLVPRKSIAEERTPSLIPWASPFDRPFAQAKTHHSAQNVQTAGPWEKDECLATCICAAVVVLERFSPNVIASLLHTHPPPQRPPSPVQELLTSRTTTPRVTSTPSSGTPYLDSSSTNLTKP